MSTIRNQLHHKRLPTVVFACETNPRHPPESPPKPFTSEKMDFVGEIKDTRGNGVLILDPQKAGAQFTSIRDSFRIARIAHKLRILF